MDPLAMIVTALAAGAAATAKDVASQAIQDGYAGLKALIIRKFGGNADVEDALESVEQRPDSEPRQEVLKEELATAQAEQDEELVGQAQALLDLLKQQGLVSGPAYQVTVSGSGSAAVGPGAVSAGEGGAAVSGDVEGGIHIGGVRDKDDE